MFNTNDNQKMYGGANNKQGLPRTVGLGQFSSNIIQRKAGFCRCLSINLYSNNTTIPATSTPHVH
jgi:hypothetical protein